MEGDKEEEVVWGGGAEEGRGMNNTDSNCCIGLAKKKSVTFFSVK